jgi:hypothetical protein
MCHGARESSLVAGGIEHQSLVQDGNGRLRPSAPGVRQPQTVMGQGVPRIESAGLLQQRQRCGERALLEVQPAQVGVSGGVLRRQADNFTVSPLGGRHITRLVTGQRLLEQFPRARSE